MRITWREQMIMTPALILFFVSTLLFIWGTTRATALKHAENDIRVLQERLASKGVDCELRRC